VITGEPIEEGQEFYTVLIEEGESFRRADFSCKAWAGPPVGAFCHFKTKVPIKEKRKKLLVDDELLINFFLRLADESEPVRIHFRFVLALILMRKRLLRYQGSSRENGVEIWQMTITRDRTEHRVVNPRLDDEQISAVSAQLSSILNNDMGEWAGEPDASTAADDTGDDTPKKSELDEPHVAK
jgi:hypothetical protein